MGNIGEVPVSYFVRIYCSADKPLPRARLVELVKDGVSFEAAWELVDAVEHHVATELDGIIYAPDDGLFDKDLKRIVSVNGSRPNRDGR